MCRERYRMYRSWRKLSRRIPIACHRFHFKVLSFPWTDCLAMCDRIPTERESFTARIEEERQPVYRPGKEPCPSCIQALATQELNVSGCE